MTFQAELGCFHPEQGWRTPAVRIVAGDTGDLSVSAEREILNMHGRGYIHFVVFHGFPVGMASETEIIHR